jgi:DNA-damage-inducible protein J
MPATSQLNIKIDAALKRDVEEVSKRIGLTPADAVRVFLLQYVSHRGFPFEVAAKESEEEWDYRERYNAETVEIIERSYDPENLVAVGAGTMEDFNKHMREM